jgi:glyoxylase I family protein
VTAARGLHHLAIQVRDLARVEAFYRDVLGLAVVRRWPAADGRGERSVWVDAGDGSFLALEVVGGDAAPAADEGPRAGLFLVALKIDAAGRDDWERRLAAAGVAITHKTAYTLYVRDPEGNRVGLSHYPHPAAGA